MVKEYDEKKFKKGILEYPTTLRALNEKNSMVLIGASYPKIKEMGIDKDTDIIVSIRKAPKKEE